MVNVSTSYTSIDFSCPFMQLDQDRHVLTWVIRLTKLLNLVCLVDSCGWYILQQDILTTS